MNRVRKHKRPNPLRHVTTKKKSAKLKKKTKARFRRSR